MTIREIRKRVKKLGLSVESDDKAALIRAVQAAEHNPQCFQTGRTSCSEKDCCWISDCVPTAAAQPAGSGDVGSRTGFWRR
jgi:hypothetical protein